MPCVPIAIHGMMSMKKEKTMTARKHVIAHWEISGPDMDRARGRGYVSITGSLKLI